MNTIYVSGTCQGGTGHPLPEIYRHATRAGFLDPQITIPITWSVVRAAIWSVRTGLSGLSDDLVELYLLLQFFMLHISPTNLHSIYPFGVRPPMLASVGFPRMPTAVFNPNVSCFVHACNPKICTLLP